MAFYRDGAARAASTKESSGRCSVCSSARSSCCASNPIPPASRRTRRTASATSSSRRVCRSSCGAAFRMMSCCALAEQRRLRDPAVLERQVRRMIADDRFTSFVEQFAGQWLFLRNLAASVPVQQNFPDFDDTLRESFRIETEMFVESVIREDRSALDLLRADYTFLNERLARHYGIPNVKGTRFRRVVLPCRQPSRRTAGAGQHPDRDVVSRSNVAGRSRQVDSREPAGHAAAAADSRGSAAQAAEVCRQGALDARAHRRSTGAVRCARAATP